MKNHTTPKPGSPAYEVETPQLLNIPRYHSSTDYRNCQELPAIENLNDQSLNESEGELLDDRSPKPNLGNNRSANEKEREKIVTP